MSREVEPAGPAKTILVVPVGGTTGGPAQAIRTARPTHVVFLVSEQSEPSIEKVITESGHSVEWRRVVRTPDAEGLGATVRVLHRKLWEALVEWNADWSEVCVDLTGGTKVMSAALALATVHRVRRYLYIGGSERTAGGTGQVITGAERPVHEANPWDVLAVEAVREASLFFDRCQFDAARERLADARTRVSDDVLRTLLNDLEAVVAGFGNWDRFDYSGAENQLKRGCVGVRRYLEATGQHQEHAESLRECVAAFERLKKSLRQEAPSELVLRDLLANALRRLHIDHRYDDAAARAYRFIEGLAQARLFDDHGLQSGAVPVDRLPPGDEWNNSRMLAENGKVKLGLEQSWRLLAVLDPTHAEAAGRVCHGGEVFQLLQTRNNSFLAHGMHPVGEDVAGRLVAACLELSGWIEAALPRFPRLPDRL